MRFIPAKAALVAAGILMGCASAPPSPGSKDETGCIKRREINAITPLDDQHVFVKVSAERFYLLTVEKGCRGLRLARSLVISDSPIRVCGDGNTLLSFEFPAEGPTRCRIEKIEAVADKDAAWDLITAEVPPE